MTKLRVAWEFIRLLILMGLGLFAAFALLLLTFIGGLGGFFTPTPYVYQLKPNADRSLSWVTETNYGGGITVSPTSSVYIAGPSFEEQVEVGTYDHGGSSRFDGWRGDRAINVCMLRYRLTAEAPPAKSSIDVMTVGGTATVVRVSWDCPPEVLEWNVGRV